MPEIPLILDCTVRDGGYMNNWDFEPRLVRDVYRAVSKAGVDYVELGYHSTPKFHDPQKYGLWRFSPEPALREACRGIRGARVALMVDSGKLDAGELPPAAESLVDLVRIAAHRDGLDTALAEAQALKDKGYQTSLQLMGFATYPADDLASLPSRLGNGPLDFVYVADSYGSIYPDQMETFLEPVKAIEGVKVGFHPHNQLQMGFANTLAAMRAGVDIVDATIYGIGRAAGNLPLEILVAYLQARRPERFSVLPLLNIIDRHFLQLKSEHPWGYQLPYMLSGLLNIHPNYAKQLVERREFSIEEIWKGLQALSRRAGVGFSKDLLDELVRCGMVVNAGSASAAPAAEEAPYPAQPAPYQNRHQGRDFLVLANGPSLASHAEAVRAFIQRYEPVVLGANYLGGLFTPHYHAFSSQRRFADYVDSVAPESRLLIGTNFREDFVRERTDRTFEWMPFVNRRGELDITRDGVVTSNCRTVSVLLCAVALVMGAQRVFVAGMDGYAGLSIDGDTHFYPEADEAEDRELILEKHRQSLHYLNQVNQIAEERGLEGLHILTPTSYAEFYKGIGNYL